MDNYISYNSLNIAESIKQTSRNKGVIIKNMLADLGLGVNTLSNLRQGSMIGADSLAKIADYLDVSVDYLLGRTGNTAENINNSVVLQGNTGNNTISNGASAADANPNSELEDEVLRVFRELDMRAKNKALTFLYDLEESERS